MIGWLRNLINGMAAPATWEAVQGSRHLRTAIRDAPEWPWDRLDDEARAYSPPAIADLVSDIRARGLDGSLKGAFGMGGLYIDMSHVPTHTEPALRIGWNADQSKFVFTYLKSGNEPKGDWSAAYPAEQVKPAFYRFITRVGWFPKGHPMLDGVSYE